MKRFIFILFLFLVTDTTITQAFSSFQNDFVGNGKKVYTVVEEMPSFKGNVNTWLISHLRFSKRIIREGVYVRVMVKFIVKSDGRLSDFSIYRSTNHEFDTKVLRVMKKMPKWNPGKHNGIPVSCYYILPIMLCPRY